MRTLILAGALTLAAAAFLPTAHAAEPSAETNATLQYMARLVGGKWVSEFKGPDGKPIAELSFQWGAERQSIRGTGTIAGTDVESRMGWDPAAKHVYYLDSHGPQTVYFGTAVLEGDQVVNRFRSIVGAPGEWESHGTFVDKDTYRNEICLVKDGKREPGHVVTLHRVP